MYVMVKPFGKWEQRQAQKSPKKNPASQKKRCNGHFREVPKLKF